MRRVTLIAVCLVVSQAFGGTTFKPTTTLTAETSSNTSTATTFTGEANGNIAGANISKVPTRSLLYKGSTAKLFAHFMPWFGFGSHVDVGYASNDPAQVQRQVNDMVSRGLDGVVVDWYGAAAHFAPYDQATQLIRQQAELHPGFTFAIMEDGGALKACAGTVGCDVTQTLITDLNYVNAMYEGSPAYLRFNGQPVIYFFGDSAYTIDWTRVRANVAGNPVFVFRNNGGFTHAQSGGGFSWLATQSIFTPSTTDPASLGYLSSYYGTALTHPALYSTGSAYKGFNDSIAAWNANRYISQQCGQTWLQSMADAGNYYSIADQMFGVQIVTWNDYEEGTEIETGIDNCVTVNASVSGTVASWSITGQSNTIDHYTVFLSQDGENLMALADVPITQHSLDIAAFGMNSGSYYVFVKAVGRPSLTNKMSNAAALVIANQPPVAALSFSPTVAYAPVTIAASTAGSSDPDGSVAASTISFGDGTSAAGPAVSHTYAAAGTYTVTATVKDNMGATSSTAGSVTVKAPEVIVSSPAAGVVVNSPIHVSGTGFSGYAVSAMQIYLDGTLVYTVNAASVDAQVNAAPGAHLLAVKGWDSSGRNFLKSMTVTVNRPPTAVLALNRKSILAGGSVSASTAGSSDLDGTIAGVAIDFGDGTVTGAASASHQYKKAGTFTVKATVTDNNGAASSSSATVSVGAAFASISSPVVVTGTTAGVVAPSTTSSTIHVVGASHSGYAILKTQVYIDGGLRYSSATANADTVQSIAKGTHLVAVQGWDASGAVFKAQFSITRH